MKLYQAILAASLLLTVIPAMARAETDYNVGDPMTIDTPTQTLCIAIAPVQQAGGLAQSCGTASISGTINKCWDDGNWNCEVTFTGTMSLGPLLCGVFTSPASSGPAQNCWTPSTSDPQSWTSSATQKTWVFSGLPKAGSKDTTSTATFSIGAEEPAEVGPTEQTVTWAPGYNFPADPVQPATSGCSSGAASVNSPSVTVSAAIAPLGVGETATVNPLSFVPLQADTPQAEAEVSTPPACN